MNKINLYNDQGFFAIDTSKAPFDGKEYLLKTPHGWAEGYFCVSWETDSNWREYKVMTWEVLDARHSFEVEDLSYWAELPSENIAESTHTETDKSDDVPEWMIVGANFGMDKPPPPIYTEDEFFHPND